MNAAPNSLSRIDFWMVLDLLANRWRWLAVGAVLCSLAALVAAAKLAGTKVYRERAIAPHCATPGVSDFSKQDGPMSPETFAALIRAPDLLQRVGEQAAPPIPADSLSRQIKVSPDAESDMVNVDLAARTPQQAVELLNMYLTNAVQYLRDLQAQESPAGRGLLPGQASAANGSGYR